MDAKLNNRLFYELERYRMVSLDAIAISITRRFYAKILCRIGEASYILVGSGPMAKADYLGSDLQAVRVANEMARALGRAPAVREGPLSPLLVL